jgi:hypothetical protein
VTPADTNGRLIEGIGTFAFQAPHDVFPTELLSPSGDSLVYLAYSGPLKEPAGANGMIDIYEALRRQKAWETSRRLTPSGVETANQRDPGGVSPDHQYTFITVNPPLGTLGGSLAAEGSAEYLGKPDGSFEFVGVGSLGQEQLAQGRFITSGGRHIIFTTGPLISQSILCARDVKSCPARRLEANAPPAGTGAIYDREAGGETRVVSLLPGEITPGANEQAIYQGVSKDATSIAFRISDTLYVRVNNGSGLTEDTLEVAQGEPTFAGLSADGRFLFYILDGEKGTVHRFDTVTATDTSVNPTAAGEVVNISADGSHVYFIAEGEIGGAGLLGAPNLYVWDGSTTTFIATVVQSDLDHTSGDLTGQCPSSFCGIPALTRWTSYAVAPPSQFEPGPGGDSSRTTPDGRMLLFESRAKLSTYNNASHTEIYLYVEGEASPRCLSCNWKVEPAQGDAQLQNLKLLRPGMVINNLSEDGSRAFFETTEPLTPDDTDGVNDIYEWIAEGAAGGSVALISSGKSTEYLPPPGSGDGTDSFLPSPNVLFSITPSGNDVAFLSQDPLVSGAGSGGVPAIYDARVGGGFPPPVERSTCFEEGCRELSARLPGYSSPQSETTAGSGNVKHHRRRCPRSRRKSHKRCRSLSHKKEGKASAVRALAGHDMLRAEIHPDKPVALTEVKEPISLKTDVLDTSEFNSFGIESVGAEESSTIAGGHPDFVTSFSLKHQFKDGLPLAGARVEDVSVSLPPGVVGIPAAFPECSTGDLIAGNCPPDAQIGIARILVEGFKNELGSPLYNLAPPHPQEEIARFGFNATVYPVFIDVTLRTASDYGVIGSVHSAPGVTPILTSRTVLWGNPPDPSHDGDRLPPGPSGLSPTAFMTNPASCQQGEVDFAVTSYQLPGQLFTASAPLAPITDCTGLPFAPSFEAEPTSHVPGAPTGLKTKLVFPQHLGSDERATATMREARVTLPEGMQVAAGAANWIGTCSDDQVGYHREVDTACPDASRLGTATIKSPALSVPIEGAIYQRSPRPGHQFGLWLTADALGLHVKLPGELEPDKTTGRLTAVFRDLPQVPVEEIDLDVWGGPRAPLQNPDRCGSFATDFSFIPHSDDPAASGQDPMQITEGCGQGFDPILKAGVIDPIAGQYSPFVFDLTRPDADQALRGFELRLPDGELATLRGVPLCPDSAAGAGSCPTDSRIGSLQATTGPGPEPFTLPEPGKPEPQIYLAGPYHGSPFSIVSEVPAQAGPFDLGTLAVRSGLGVEPETGRAVVKADPLPQFFEGVGIAYRQLHAVIDRPQFNINPTDCREMAVTADATSTQGATAHPSARFQVDGCKALKFKPKLSLRLKGGTKRADYPALTAVLKAHKGDANIASVSVALPHSEFLAQEHIGTICTRVQFAADKCPKGSVYGKAKAWTPLLAKPLSGPVYLRSSDHPLPDLVAKLGGELEVHLVGRIDSVRGGIRTSFESVPDAPVSRFVLQMKGGKKGLLTNSTDICRGAHKATVAMKAQNGRRADLRPRLQISGCGGKKLGKHKNHH